MSTQLSDEVRMTVPEIERQALALPLSERWRLVHSLLGSIQQESMPLEPPSQSPESLADLDPWTRSLVGVVQLDGEDPTEVYVDYLEEKYR